MNPFALLAGPLKLWIYGAIAAALLAGAWRLHHVIDAKGYDRAVTQYTAAALKAEKAAQARHDEQAATAAAAAADYEKQASANETQMKAARHEIYVATENLASCKLSAGAVGLFNNARRGTAAKH